MCHKTRNTTFQICPIGVDDRRHEVRRGGEILAAEKMLRHGALLRLSNPLLRGKSCQSRMLSLYSYLGPTLKDMCLSASNVTHVN